MALPTFRLPFARLPGPAAALVRPFAGLPAGPYGRVAARLCLAVLLLAAAGTTGLLWFGYEVQALRPVAQERLRGAATAAAGEVQALLQRAARAMDGIRPEDALAADRIAVAGRLLRLEPRVQPAAGLFLFNARGGFVAASAPLPPGTEDVSAQPWFRAGMGGPAGEVRLAGPAVDPLGRQTGLLLLRRLDRGGVPGSAPGGFSGSIPVGLAGTFLKADAAWLLLHQAWSLPQVRLVLLGRDGQPIPMPDTADLVAEDAQPPAPGTPAAARAWLRRAFARAGTDTTLAEEQPLGGWSLRATADLLDLLAAPDWAHAAIKGGLAALAVLLGGLLPGAIRSRLGRSEAVHGPSQATAARIAAKVAKAGAKAGAGASSAAPGARTAIAAAGAAAGASSGMSPDAPAQSAKAPLLDADWIWELDSRGRLVGVAGNAPAHLIQAIGCPLVEVAGPQAEQDRNWAVFRAAARNGDVIAGLDLPFAFPGAAADQVIRVRLTGKPVRDTGGYWGAALQLDTPQDQGRTAYRMMDALPAAA